MADKRITDFIEAASAGADYYLVTDSLVDGVKKIKPSNIVPAYTGDVTSAAGGTVNTIAANAVTNTKAAQMAAGTIKSNITGALASASDNTIAAVMDAAFGATQGAVAYRNATGWTSLPPGTSGQFFQTSGPAANPIWQTIPGGGNMLSSTYDPTGKLTDAFDSANHVDFTRAAIATKTIPAAVTALHTSGYSVAGDGGAAVYKRISTPAPVQPWHIQSADGAYWQLSVRVVNQYHFGAVDDHATDCRAAFQASIDYAEAMDAEIKWAPGWHNVQEAPASAGYCLKVNRAIKMTGAGFARTFLDPAGVAATVDVILVQHAAVGLGLIDGIHLADFWIGTPSATNRAGRHGINIDCTAAGANVVRSVIERLYINQNLNGGVGIYINNNATNNPNGGYTTSTIRNCLIGNGIRGLNIGDSINFQELTVLGPGNGIDITQVTNAGSMTIERNNITSDGGAIVIHQARNPKILYNNIENFTGAGSTGAIVDIDITGLSSGLLEFKGNNIALLPGTTATTCLRLSGTTLADVDTNTFAPGGLASKTAIKIEASAATTTVGQSNIFQPGFTTLVNDLGTGTRGVTKALTLGSGVANIGSGYVASNYFVSPEGEVAIEIAVNCTSPNGATIATLPAALWPATHRRFQAVVNNGAVQSFAFIDVFSNGNIVFTGNTDVIQIFASGRFQLPYVVVSV